MAILVRRVVVGVRSFLQGAECFRNVAKIDSNAGPCGRPASHGIDENIIDGQVFRRIGMIVLPALESCEGGFFVG